jgi:hypothetical protein
MGEEVTVGGWRPEIDVRVVRLGDSLTMVIPERWRIERLPDGRWWCGDDATGESVVTDARLAARREETPAGATPRQAARVYLDHFRGVLEEIDGITRIESATTETDYLLRSEGIYLEDGDRFRERRWYLFRGVDDDVAVFRIALHVREPVRDARRFDALVELFERQIHAAHGRMREPGGSEVEALQEFTMDGVVTLRLPARWSFRQNGEDWYCYDPDGRPGRLWAGYDLFRPRGDAADSEAPSAQELAQEYSDAWDPDGHHVLFNEVQPAPLGAIIRLIDEDIDEGSGDPDDQPLRCHRWIYIALRGDEPGVMSHYTLMFPIALADQPELEALVHLIDTQVRAQRLESGAAV